MQLVGFPETLGTEYASNDSKHGSTKVSDVTKYWYYGSLAQITNYQTHFKFKFYNNKVLKQMFKGP